jgi:hypothetical protein
MVTPLPWKNIFVLSQFVSLSICLPQKLVNVFPPVFSLDFIVFMGLIWNSVQHFIAIFRCGSYMYSQEMGTRISFLEVMVDVKGVEGVK